MENFVQRVSGVLNIGVAGLIFGSFEIVLMNQAYEYLNSAEKCNAICNIIINFFNASILLYFSIRRYITNCTTPELIEESNNNRKYQKRLFDLISIIELVLQVLCVSVVALSSKHIHLSSGLEIVQTCSYGFLICNYYSSCQTVIHYIRTNRILKKSLSLEISSLMVFWGFGIGSYIFYQLLVLSSVNRGFLATIFCFLAFKLVENLQKTINFMNFLWIPASFIPSSIFLNSIIELNFLEQNRHYFFKKAIIIEFLIVSCFLIIQLIRAYRQLYKGFEQLKRFKQQRDSIVKYEKKLQILIANSKKTENIIQNTSLSTIIDKQWECNICIFGKTNEQTVISLKCGHFFHQDCIRSWTKIKFSCPSCRKQYQEIV